MELQAKRVQAWLVNLQRKYKFIRVQRLKEDSHAAHEMKSVKQEKVPVCKRSGSPVKPNSCRMMVILSRASSESSVPPAAIPASAYFPETCKHSLRCTESAGPSTQSRSLGDSFHQAAESDVGHLDEAGFEDEYMPISTLPSILLAMKRAGWNAQIIHNPRNPRNPHFVPPSCSLAALLSHKDLIRGSKVQPPTVDHSLKPRWKGKCTHSLFHLLTIYRLCSLYQLSDGFWSWGCHWVNH
ncbi:Coiled-coil domain-containing protein 138 [Sciurus carolinensis]|uniref:Coiled-coil domain-containing protein 138 n=1 Tax=Sciurus carolinensis TaxID=30640 RepID=A0AA41MBV4_SCICA|nr:Coiled-coil domain-containing protein 138 [Sciurus carolinensis]